MGFDVEEYESELRGIVEERVGAFDTDEDWDHWFGEVCDETFYSLGQAADILVARIQGARRHMPHRSRRDGRESYSFGTAPSWWPDRMREELGKWREAQAQVLAAFGLDAPMTLREADAMLVCALDSQERVGHKAIFEFTHYGNEPTFSTPYPADSQLEVIEQGVAYSGNAYGWIGARRAEKPLYVLATLAGMLEWQTGCRPFEAVDFLLCDEPFEPPWVGVDMREGSGVIEMRIGSPSVPAADVTKAYLAAVSALRASQPDVIESAPKRRRSRRSRTLELLDFVGQEHPQPRKLQEWRLLLKKWNEVHPDRSFPTPEAMRERYRRVAKDDIAGGRED